MGGQTASDLQVHIQKADYQLVRIRADPAALGVQAFQQGFRRQLRGQQQRVPAPDHPLPAEPFRQAAEGFQALLQRGQARLQALGFIIVERELKVILEAVILDFRQMRQQGQGIFAPEDQQPATFEGNVLSLSGVKGIAPETISGAQAFQQPADVKSRNVRGPAG